MDENINRRRYDRMDLRYKIIMTVNNATIIGVLDNISACGASFIIQNANNEQNFKIGDNISFALASDSSYLKFVGSIVRINQKLNGVQIAISFF